ncbi:Sel1 repeat protein [Sorangium cellulosum]|uniref:Sel1 repeat protein n=1 Tax=Sorangium cellulosum TaxID=56 RepID=A0A150T1R4_SORCE|nr:Sel1 repeat protein [Sorangium cellulosum]KYF98684.1 Sel1 repeat protein [Sorangium cellulosum]
MKRAFDMCVVGLSLAATACGPGLDPEVVVHPPRPTVMPASSAGENTGGCPAIGHTEPLIVDWLTTRRSDLGLAMKEGVAVVSYDCTTLKLLAQCKLQGTYSYAGVSRNENVIQLTNPAEMQANVPFGAPALSTAIEGNQTAAFDVALVPAGKMATTVTSASAQDLSGSCEGATHFVRAALLGAFAMAPGSRGAARTVDQVFAAVGPAAASNQGGTASREGELEACRAAKPDAQAPTDRCHAPLRLELVPLEAKKAETAEPAAKPAEDELPKLASSCPVGTVRSGAKCSPPAATPAHLCEPADARACAAQCGKGDVGSCYHLGIHYLSGKDLPRDDARAAELFEKACGAGVTQACYARARLQLRDIQSAKVPPDTAGRAKVREFADKACEMGDGWACFSAAEWYLSEGPQAVLPKDATRAVAFLRRGCDLGYGPSCSALGKMLIEGKLAAKDVAVAVGVLQRACEGGQAEDCVDLGDILRKGQGAPKDGVKAIAAYRRGCSLGDMRACNAAGAVFAEGDGVPRDVAKAYSFFEKGCPEKGFGAEACMSLAGMYEKGTGIPKDMARAAALYEKVCGSGGCLRAAEIWQRGDGVTADPERAFSLYEKACSQWGEKKACDAFGQLLEKKDKERARAFYAEQCSRTQDKAACASQKRLGGARK